MKTLRSVVATTRVDADGEALADEGVALLVEQMNSQCIPMWVQHDPRQPPVGRFIAAEAKRCPDGEVEVVATAEMWERGEDIPLLPDRFMPLGKPEHGRPFVSFDRGMVEDLDDLEAVASMLGSAANREAKKALEPLTVLTLGGTFILGAIASGFFGQIGADVYTAVKEKLQAIVRRRRGDLAACVPPREFLFVFKAFVENGGQHCLVDVIITNPHAEDVAWLLESGLRELDVVVPMVLSAAPDVRRLVLEVNDGNLYVSFGVRGDAAPIPLRDLLE
jgi:hypothetical protein